MYFHLDVVECQTRKQTLPYSSHRQQTANCAATCDFQQCGILTSVNSDEPVQPPLKLRK